MIFGDYITYDITFSIITQHYYQETTLLIIITLLHYINKKHNHYTM